MATIYLISPTGGYATAQTLAGALELERRSSMRRCDLATYERTRIAAAQLPPIPAPARLIRIPLDQLHEYLRAFGLHITRRVELTGGGWRVDLEAANPPLPPPVEC